MIDMLRALRDHAVDHDLPKTHALEADGTDKKHARRKDDREYDLDFRYEWNEVDDEGNDSREDAAFREVPDPEPEDAVGLHNVHRDNIGIEFILAIFRQGRILPMVKRFSLLWGILYISGIPEFTILHFASLCYARGHRVRRCIRCDARIPDEEVNRNSAVCIISSYT